MAGAWAEGASHSIQMERVLVLTHMCSLPLRMCSARSNQSHVGTGIAGLGKQQQFQLCLAVHCDWLTKMGHAATQDDDHHHHHHHHDHDHDHHHEDGHQCDEHCHHHKEHKCDDHCHHDHDHEHGHDHKHEHEHEHHGHLDHKHDDRVTSVGIQMEGDCDMQKLNEWLSKLLQERGADLFRSKGILSISGSDHK